MAANRSLAEVPFAALARLVQTRFPVHSGAGRASTLVLEEARRASARMDGGDSGLEVFSLIFSGNPACALEQGTYGFEHARLGRFEMFIVPVDRAQAGRIRYEAVFQRPPPRRSRGDQSEKSENTSHV